MKIIQEHSVEAFTTSIQELLLQREAENNLPLGILKRLQESSSDENSILIKIEEEGRPVFMTMRTPPHLWILPSIATVTSSHIKSLARYLFENQFEVPGILGEGEAVQQFIDAWVNITGENPIIHMRQGIYRLNELRPIHMSEGELVEAKECDFELVKKWLTWFGEETNEGTIKERTAEMAEEMIRTRRMYLWIVNGEAVSMAARARVTPHGVTINAVFTPDEYKRRGYATQAVWTLTKKLLDQGYQFCSLYTDLDNHSSNSIYKKIGYEWVGNSIVYHFID
ncbi:GNAT family N-acetyltransferase [Halobacillus halophilus]|uniref:GNAT family N-acetyltransferase n=1 Tax=Halobacillus halophilus TaxID=1570 RepID=UPI001CD25EB9|nr:GNAT family N-acetyltransferase [Halobacillus halophilus]MCA1010993.1 GNAT family N-acetyltransferase [Halobacillus halophilus]